MKITIVIPVYNVEPYIKDCLASVAAQTYNGNMECIIVNDCTPDGSCAIIEHFIKEYDGKIEFKLLHHSRNRGLSVARNTGIDVATGDYIYFLDSDDEIMPECIELLTTPLKCKKYDFVIGDYKTVGSNKKKPPLLLDNGELLTNYEIRSTYFANKWYVMAVNKLCNLEFLRKNKLLFKENLINEDELWSFQLACTAQSMSVVRHSTYKYKIRESSIMGQQRDTNRAYALSVIFNEAYKWSEEKGVLYDYGLFHKILNYRELVFSIIFSQKTCSHKKELFLKCYKNLHINPLHAYKNRMITSRSLIKEFYNYLPFIVGFYYLIFYNTILKR